MTKKFNEKYEQLMSKTEPINEDMATVGFITLGVLGGLAAFSAVKAVTKIGIKHLGTKAVEYLADREEKKVEKERIKRIEDAQSRFEEALERLQAKSGFKKVLQDLLDNPFGGTEDMYLKGKYKYNNLGKVDSIKKAKKDDFNKMKRERTKAVKDMKDFVANNLSDEDKDLFMEISKHMSKQRK